MGKKLTVLLLSISLFLCAFGCEKTSKNSQNDLKSIQKEYADSTGMKTDVHILSNLNERTLEYDISYEYNKESGGKIEVKAPEEIAGITATIEADNTYTLNYEDTSLETAMPDRKGLTPADAVPYLLSDIQKAYPTQVWNENGKIAARFEQTTDDGMISKEVYFDEKSKALCDAEIYLDGHKLLGCTFSKFEFVQ